MIFTLEDRLLLGRVATRKGCELAMLSSDGDCHDTAVLVDTLVTDIGRIRLMVDIGENRLEGIPDRIGVVLDEFRDTARPVYDRYVESLQGADREDEVAYRRLLKRLLAHMGMIDRGVEVSAVISGGGSPYDHRRLRAILDAKDVLAMMAEGMSDRLGDLAEVTGLLAMMCSQLLCVHSGRNLANAEIAWLVDRLDRQDLQTYRYEALQILDPEDADRLGAFLSDYGYHLAVLYGRAVSNSELSMPEPE